MRSFLKNILFLVCVHETLFGLHVKCFQYSDNHFAIVNMIDKRSNRRLDVCKDGMCANRPTYKENAYYVSDAYENVYSQMWEILYANGSSDSPLLIRIKSVHNGRYVTGTNSESASVQLKELDELNDYQIWILNQIDNDLYSIVSRNNNVQLDCFFNGTVYQSKVREDQSKLWRISFTQIGNLDDVLTRTNRVFENIEPLTIQSARTGLVLSNDFKYNIVQTRPTHDNLQKWTIQQQSDGTVKIQNYETKFYLNSQGKTSPPNEDAQNKDQNWILRKENDYYFIQNVANKMYLHRHMDELAVLVNYLSDEEKWYIRVMNDGITEMVSGGYNGHFNVKSARSGGYLECTSNSNVQFNEKDKNKAKKWKFVPFNIGKGDFYLLIQNIDTNKVLDSRMVNQRIEPYCHPITHHPNQKWILLSSSSANNAYWIYNLGTKKHLFYSGHLGQDILPQFTPDCTFNIEFDTSNFNLTTNVIDMNFKIPSPSFIKSKSKVDSVHFKVCSNRNSSSTLTVVYEDTQVKSSTFDYGFRQNIDISTTTSMSSSLPFFKTSMELSAGFSFESTQDFSETVTETVGVHETIHIPPNSELKAITLINKVENIQFDFNARAFMSMHHSIKNSDGSVRKFTMSGDAVAWYIQSKKFNGQIQSVKSDGVYVALSGTIRGNFGLSVDMIIEDL